MSTIAPIKPTNLDEVRGFLDWMEDFLRSDGPRQVCRVITPNGAKVSLSTVEEASRSYTWGYDSSVDALEVRRIEWKTSLDTALFQGDQSGYESVCIDIRKWGRIPKSPSPPPFDHVSIRLTYLTSANWGSLFSRTLFPYMSSYHSKIYWALSRNLAIYDSRTASALCSFIYQYAAEKLNGHVPETLRLGIPKGNYKRERNPDSVTFRWLHSGESTPGKYAESTIYASWIMNELATAQGSTFANCKNPLLSLQSAMFMLGQPPQAMGAGEC